MTRAKFRVESIEDFGTSKQVKLRAVSPRDGEMTDENASFFRATPYGEMKMAIDNPAAAAQFMHGEEFYVDFTPCKPHDSDCARHNAPAMVPGPCDCSRSRA